jgi:hypothetical protein
MDTKLTIRVPRQLVENAKRYASDHRISLTKMIVAYLGQIPIEQNAVKDAPLTRQIAGSLSQKLTTSDYKKHLEEKYGE